MLKKKNIDPNFGFEMVRLDENVMKRATKLLQIEFTNQLGARGKKAKERKKELRTLEHSPHSILP
jgi:hypothetical protein